MQESITSSPRLSNRLSSRPCFTLSKKIFRRRSFKSSCFGLGAFLTARLEKGTSDFAFKIMFSWPPVWDLVVGMGARGPWMFALRGERGDGCCGRNANGGMEDGCWRDEVASIVVCRGGDERCVVVELRWDQDEDDGGGGGGADDAPEKTRCGTIPSSKVLGIDMHVRSRMMALIFVRHFPTRSLLDCLACP